MKTSIVSNRSVIVSGAMAGLAVAVMGFSSGAQARDNVYWSIGVGTPGAVVQVGNVGSVYPQPVYVQPQPVYVRPRPVYVQPAPVYYQPRPVFVQPGPVYLAPQPVYRDRPHGRRWKHDGHGYGKGQGYGRGYGERGYVQSQGPGYGPGYGHGERGYVQRQDHGPGYGEVHYQRDGRR